LLRRACACCALDAALKQLGDMNGLVIDVRGNSGGAFDAGRAFRNFDPNDNEEPDRPRYTGPIALLLDERRGLEPGRLRLPPRRRRCGAT
jgi:hypothetical protein